MSNPAPAVVHAGLTRPVASCHGLVESTSPATSTSPGATASTLEDEGDVLCRLLLGRPDAWEELVRGQLPRLLAVARRILRDEEAARDAVQEAFVAAFRRLDTFGGHSRFSTWIHRITVNAALMRLRSRRARPEDSLEELLPRFEPDGRHSLTPRPAPVSQDELLCREELRTLVRRAIDRLPEAYRTVVLLRDIEELDTSETAALLRVSPAAVKVRLHRARQALRTMLERSELRSRPLQSVSRR